MRRNATVHDGAREGAGRSDAVGPATRGDVKVRVWRPRAAACGVTIGTFRHCDGLIRQLRWASRRDA